MLTLLVASVAVALLAPYPGTGVGPALANPYWGAWTAWLPCDRTCGSGKQSRSRVCIGGLPTQCVGLPKEERLCNPQPCPIGSWTEWIPWTVCSLTCGGGNQRRNRVCIGGTCPGLNAETRPCNPQLCPGGSWGVWTPWLACSAPCGGGRQARNRICIGGTLCPGLGKEERPCNLTPCKIVTPVPPVSPPRSSIPTAPTAPTVVGPPGASTFTTPYTPQIPPTTGASNIFSALGNIFSSALPGVQAPPPLGPISGAVGGLGNPSQLLNTFSGIFQNLPAQPKLKDAPIKTPLAAAAPEAERILHHHA